MPEPSNIETPSKNLSLSNLPESLRKQFAALEQRLWKEETTVAVCTAVGAGAVSYLALFLSDRFWNTPIWMRSSIAFAGWLVAFLAGLHWFRRWVIKRRDLRALSKLVQRRFRRLGDRLLGIVELSEDKQGSNHFSPELYRAALRQVTDEASRFDFGEAVELRRARIYAVTTGSLIFLILIPLFLVPAATWNAFARWINPVGNIQRYTLVHLNGTPTDKIVAHGEPFELSSKVEYRSFWRPSRGIGRFGTQPKIETAVENQEVRFNVPAQTQPGALRIQVGDAKQEVAIHPTHRPSLKDMVASVTLPTYLQYPSTNQPVPNGTLTAVEGSIATFAGKTSRALQKAQVLVEGKEPSNLSIEGTLFSSSPLALTGLSHVAFSWTDDLGLSNSVPWRVNIQTVPDLPPRAEFPDLAREIAILETEVVQLKTSANDDYGVKEIGLNWQLVAAQEPGSSALSNVFKTTAKIPTQPQLEHVFRFSPAILKIPADTMVELKAYAVDYFPGRTPTESPIYRIHVLGTASHAEMVRQELESVLAQLEEVTRLEESIAQATDDLKNQSSEQMATEQSSEKIAEARENQAQNAANLEQLAKQGAETLREAARNPSMPEKTLREWAQSVQQMQQLAQSQMQKASKSLASAQQNQESRAQDLAKAAEKQDEILQSLEQMQKQFNRNLDNLQAMTLAQRLRKVASEQKDVEGRIQKNIQDTIGLLAKDLPERFKKANEFLVQDHVESQKEAQALQAEISRFYERTRQESYGVVSREMTESKASEQLDSISALIQKNIGMQASQNLADWSARFNGWADKLEPKSQGGSSGSGGGSGNGQEDGMAERLMQQLLALLRMREGEINLRERTEILNSQKSDTSEFHEASDALSKEQRQLLKRLVAMQLNNPFEALQEALAEIYEPMQEAETLLSEGNTGEKTVGSETKAIDVITDVVNIVNEQMQKGSNSQSAMAQEMAFLMQMMMQQQEQQGQGMTVGRNPGRSSAGGSTDKESNAMPGDAQGNEAEERKVKSGSGLTGEIPTEFREALQNYYEAIEQQNP